MAELDYELPRFVRVYKDGSVERLMGTDTVPAGIDPETGVESKDILVTPESGVSARLYLPKNRDSSKKIPLVIYFHGGGFYCFTPFSTLYRSFLNSFVAEGNVILISIDYRRPPEHHVPVAYEDSWTAIQWVASHSNGTGQEAWLNEFADFGNVHLVGDSAGANIAHCMAIRAGSEKVNGINFDGLILMHPYFWGKDPVGEETDDTERRAFIDRYWLLACPTSSGVDDPWMNPGLDPKLSSLVCKRALIFGAEEDFLKYRAKYYGEVLGKSGWAGNVEVVEIQGEVHVFHLYKPKTQKTKELIQKVVSFIYRDVYDAPEKLGFEKVSEQFIEECKSNAVLFKHKKTGAEVMSVSNDDENKVFGVVFRTPPKDSTGIPHILEHSVLCGSRKYPLKEPFVELLKGSLHTFLNAFTYPDRTCYPVASTNAKDFYNLVDVYLDAVFFPKCVEDIHTFQQEGWHHELNDPSEDIIYKGVVFNEMKGVYSQPDNILGRSSQQAVFPDNTYGVDSGGDPLDIPKLTFDEFKEFHRKYYHPSNARIWFYGDDDPIERLRILSEYLDMFDASTASNESIIKPQKLFLEPLRVIKKYPATEGGELGKKHMVCLNWLISDKPLDLETELAFGFLDHLLLGTPASPLRKILLESSLGEAIVGGGVESELLQPQFSTGLKGVSEEDIKKVEDLVMDTLKSLAETGFDTDAVEASMNTIEFSLRENNTGSSPRGLVLMLQSIGKWIYDMDPFEPLKYQKPLMALKARIAEEGSKAVFAPLIEKFILNNPHRVTIEMQPDAEKASRDEAAERKLLDNLKASMTEEDLAKLARATQELRLKQETPDSPEALKRVPSLSLQDIPKVPLQIPIEIGGINGVKVLQHDLFTNDVLYSEVLFDMSSLKQELLPLVPLFCQSLMEMGTKDMEFVQLNQLIGRKTGGISVYPFTSSVRGKDDPCSHMIVRGKAMSGRTEDLFDLINRIIQDVQFTDQKRFKQFISQSKAQMEDQLQGSGHGIVAARMEAKLNVAGWINEQMGGVSYLEFLQSLEEKVDLNWNEILSSLEEIRKSLFTKSGCLINLTADGKNLTNSEKYVSKFLDSLPTSSSVQSKTWNARLPLTSEAIVIPTQVNYVGKAANLYETGYKFNGSAYVISKHISNTWLWDRVRVSGGAYGGFCDFDTHSGVFSFLSYRDPNLLKTLDIYDGTSDFLRKLKMDDDALTKAIIGTIGEVDSYQLPDAKGYSSLLRYLLGVEEEERQKRREEILSTSLGDFKEFAETINSIKDNGVVVAVASPDDVDNANKERPNFFEIKKAL